MTRSLAIAALGALAVGCGAQAAATQSPAGNRAAARADAPVLLARLKLPSGASPAKGEPAGDGGQLTRPATGPPATPNAVERTGFWRVPGLPAAVVAYVDAHPPAGSRRFLTGSGVAGFDWPARRGVLSVRWLVVHAVALADGSTGVRADAEVVWMTRRPARERDPAGITRLQVTVTSSSGARRTRAVTAPSRINRVSDLLNALPLAQPGAMSCPADIGALRVRLAFYRGRDKAAVADVDPGGCGFVTFALHGRRQPPLMGARGLIAPLQRALGFRFTPRR